MEVLCCKIRHRDAYTLKEPVKLEYSEEFFNNQNTKKNPKCISSCEKSCPCVSSLRTLEDTVKNVGP